MKPLERRSKKALLKIIKGFEGFPDGNPNPVFRISADRVILYCKAFSPK